MRGAIKSEALEGYVRGSAASVNGWEAAFPGTHRNSQWAGEVSSLRSRDPETYPRDIRARTGDARVARLYKRCSICIDAPPARLFFPVAYAFGAVTTN